MYYKEMTSEDCIKEIRRIIGYTVLTDVEKCLLIKSFCNNLVDSDVIKGEVAYIKRGGYEMNKELYEKLLKISEDFEDYYGDDWDKLYYHDITAVDMIKVVSLLIDNVKDSMLVEIVIKKVFDSEEPIGFMVAFVYYKAIM